MNVDTSLWTKTTKILHRISSEKRTLKQQWGTATGWVPWPQSRSIGNSQRMPLMVHHVTFRGQWGRRLMGWLDARVTSASSQELWWQVLNNRDSHPQLGRIQNIVATSRESWAVSCTSARWYSYWTELQIPRNWKLISTQKLAQGCFG